METGQRSLMPNSNKIIQHNELSIHSFVNGFSFCTQSKVDFLPANNDQNEFNKAFEEFIDYYPKKTFTAISLIHFEHPSTFIPKALFSENHLERYLSHYKTNKGDSSFQYDILDEEDQVNVYSYPKEIQSLLETTETRFQETHYNTILSKILLNLARESADKTQLYIHLQKDSMDLFLTKEDSLVFHNRFSTQSEDEFLYYVFFVVEQFELENKAFEIVFLGKMDPFDSFYAAIKLYHNNIRFHQEIIISKQAIENHNAPFLAQYFS
jgi:hypothetical protein